MSAQDHRIVQIRAGNKEVFAEIYETYFDEIYAYIWRKIDQTKEVEDLVSHTFFQAFTHLEKAVSGERVNIRARLYKIASNQVIDYYRRHREVDIPETFELPDESTTALEQVETDLVTETIMEHLRELGEEIHDIFVMRFWQQLSYAEISTVNGKSIGNNKKIYSRACQSLRDRFSHLRL